MANIDAGNGEWLRWSDDAPLTSETGDDRDRATLKVVNECSKPLHVPVSYTHLTLPTILLV